jgi:flagellar hook-associated protein 2
MSSSLTISNNRISGLASGLDTDTIITGLISSDQTKIDKVSQQKTKDEWTEDAYRDVNTLVNNFRTKYLSALSDSNMMSTKVYAAYTTSMLTDSSAVTVSASSSASTGSMSVDSITQLATAASSSSKDVFTGDSYSSKTTLGDISLSNSLEFDSNDQVSFKINDVSFTFDKDTTIGDMMSQINSSDAGVKMSDSELNKGFTIKSTSTGSSSSLVISNTSGNAFSSSDSAFGISEDTYTGQDAVCSINGVSVTQSSNKFTYDGITYNLKDTSSSAVKFSVSQDIDTPVQKIEDFVDAYNDLVDSLQSKIGEDYSSDYPPLTDAQKEDMTDDEIADWNTKAKTGLLHNDTYISSMLTSLRSALYTSVEDAGMSPSDIGLNTGTYTDGAKITIDEDTLRSAIEKDPDKVTSIFSATGDDTSSQGLTVRISNAMLNYTSQTTKIALSDLETNVSSLDDKKDTLEDALDDKKDALYLKFSNMESALSKLSSMSTWLSSFFSSSSS